MILRDYQQVAVDSVYRHIRSRPDNPCVVIPTGGGKSPVMARICADTVGEWQGKVILLAHVRELLTQSFDHLKRVDPTLPVGIYSAGMGDKNSAEPITVAGIQSAFRHPEEFDPPDLIIIDEAHRIPMDGDGMYRSFISDMKGRNPDVRVVGFTATPYRMSSGPICTSDGILNHICHETTIRELLSKGFLSPVVAYGPPQEEDYSGVRVRGGEFVLDDLQNLANDDVKVLMAVNELVERCADRKSILVFSSGVDHGKLVARMVRESVDQEVGEVYGDTPADQRDDIIRRFRDGSLRWLVNCDVLTLGFDAPNVDAIGILRATLSPGLYYQMCGRGFRLHPSKQDCLIIDFGGNVLRHGPVDVIEPDAVERHDRGVGDPPAKKCPQCLRYVALATLHCPTCGFAFPPREKARHEERGYSGRILSGGEEETIEVRDVIYEPHLGRQSGMMSLRVTYQGPFVGYTEYICLEHTGYARQKAVEWWTRRHPTEPPPDTVDQAVRVCDGLARPKQIRVFHDGKYARVTGYRF